MVSVEFLQFLTYKICCHKFAVMNNNLPFDDLSEDLFTFTLRETFLCSVFFTKTLLNCKAVGFIVSSYKALSRSSLIQSFEPQTVRKIRESVRIRNEYFLFEFR